MTNNFNFSNERKVQTLSKRELMAPEDINEKREMHITSSNLENMVGEGY